MNSKDTKETLSYKTIKLGIDVHAKSYTVVRQIDGATPQPAQRFTPEKFLNFVAKQKSLCESLYCCYEAGPFGYVLHRRLTSMGVTNYVVAPQNWDEQNKGVKTDSLDALALCLRLERYVQGNRKAFCVIKVPTPEQEQARHLSRQREQLKRHRQRIQAQGRSLLLQHGIQVSGYWWQGKTWERIQEEASESIIELLEVYIKIVIPIYKEEKQLTDHLKKIGESHELPLGLGGFSYEQMRREVLDWSRFSNRREVSSLTGLCPREFSSGSRKSRGCINKHGNPVLRQSLIECAWRLLRYQPDYPPIQKRLEVLISQNSAAKKKAIVAVARRLAVDLWRLFTERANAEKLGLRLKEEAAT